MHGGLAPRALEPNRRRLTTATRPDAEPAMSLLQALIDNPQLVLAHRNIFLLSHMRANTSLFGHLLGSHPQVEGYYEMHIGYFSWKSLWRQKLLHFKQHRPKPSARWMFDKVLHDGHAVAPALLRRPHSRPIFMLREPEQSIRSLVVMYQAQLPHRPEATPEGAARYYIDRLKTLNRLAEQLSGRCFYLDAECLVTDTRNTLNALGDWLEFDTPIPSKYQTFLHTGRQQSGDTSAQLRSGTVSHQRADYSAVRVPDTWMRQAHQSYQVTRTALIGLCQHHQVMTHPGSSVDDLPD